MLAYFKKHKQAVYNKSVGWWGGSQGTILPRTYTGSIEPRWPASLPAAFALQHPTRL